MIESAKLQDDLPPVASPCTAPEPGRSIERFAPDAEFRESHEILIRAPAELVFEVAERIDLLSLPAVRAIFWLRAKILGAPPPERDDLKELVAATKAMGWGELARRPGRELVMGATVQPWLPEPIFEPVPPERFRGYEPPEHVKIVWTLEAEPLGASLTRFRTETRVQPTDDAARMKFRRYRRFARVGILLIRRLMLPAVRKEAERRLRAAEALASGGDGSSAPLLERLLPEFDAALVRETTVDAPADVTYAAIGDTNLLDPVVRSLFAVRELPTRFLAWIRPEGRSRTPRSITVNDFLRPGMGMVRLAEDPGVEIVVGSVGHFWEREYGQRKVEAGGFADFREPGYAKLALDLWVRPAGEDRSILRYEARTATTDDDARLRFVRYWRLIRPGVWLVMGRAVALIRREAERESRTAEQGPASSERSIKEVAGGIE